MEYFEKAHIVKNNDSKSKKTTENVKKQLKQMLHGYKVSDNKLIQNSADLKSDYDDSSSVSGFSDLNLTNSSLEDDGHPSITANEGSSLRDVGDNSSSSNTLSDNVIVTDSSSKIESYDSVSENMETISESSENIKSPSENLSEKDNDSSINESEISIVSGILESSPESDKSETFDADGTLAAKILENLKLNSLKNKSCKRKHSEIIESPSSTKKGSCKNKNRQEKYDKNKKDKYNQDINLQEMQSSEEDDGDSDDNDISQNSDADDDNSNPTSPEYVSITAKDMPQQRLAELVGEYRYTTVRKLPKDYQHLAFTTSNSGIFIEESITKDLPTLPVGIETSQTVDEPANMDLEVEDEISSIIPEVDDITTTEIIEEELSSSDTTTPSNVNETSDTLNNIDNTLQPEVLSDREPSVEEESVNTFAETSFKLYYCHNSCIIILKHPTKLFMQGKVRIKALGGTVEVFGYTLTDQFQELYAPYNSYAQCISTVNNNNLYAGLFHKLTSAGLSTDEAETIVTTAGDQDGIILLEPLHKKSIEFVDNAFKTTNLFVKPYKNIDPYFIKACTMLNCSLFSLCPYQHLDILPTWVEANIYAQLPKSKGIVCGGKGTGKSTYLRYQVNKLVAKGPVLVVDLDPGQSEFTPAGSLSATVVNGPLLGPSFTHLKNPLIMYNIGMINTMDNVRRYLLTVRTLLTLCFKNRDIVDIPWVVNTMGLTNNLGLKFMIYIIILVQPSYVVQFHSKVNKKMFETFFRATTVKLLYLDHKNDKLLVELPHPSQLNYDFVIAHETSNKIFQNPKDERYLNFLAYFSQLINTKYTSLLSVIPYMVPLNSLVIVTNVGIKQDSIMKVINGKVVVLCQHFRQSERSTAKVFKLSDKAFRCYGHGLIRGIDWEEGILYVITPVPSNELGWVNCLLYADWVPELVGLENQLPKGTVVPYRTITEDQHKQLMSAPHRRFNPLQLLKMARSS